MIRARNLLIVLLMALPTTASAQVFDDLNLEWDFFIRGGGVLVDSVGLSVRAGAPTVGVVTVDSLPERSAITQAFLYWMTIGGLGDDTVTFEGQTIVGTEVGSCEDTCWSIGPNFVYRADVSSIVTLPGDYEISDVGDGVASGYTVDGQGATILTFYDDPGAENAGFVKIYEGARDNMSGPGTTVESFVTFDNLFIPTLPTRAEMTWSVGDSQSFPDGATTFEGNTLAVDNFDETEQGPLWDTDEWDVLPYLSVGQTEAEAGLSVGGSSDCLAIGLAILEYELPCEFDGDNDGSGICDDCDDQDPTISGEDLDSDGFTACTGDCDDTNGDVHAGHPELCDGVDNNCDGVMLDGEDVDGDGDGYPGCDDCDDTSSDINPGATEICDNGEDEDCDTLIDEDDCGDDDDAADDDDDDNGPDDDDSANPGDDDDDGGGGGGRSRGGCGCDAAGGVGLPLLMLLGLRRRR